MSGKWRTSSPRERSRTIKFEHYGDSFSKSIHENHSNHESHVYLAGDREALARIAGKEIPALRKKVQKLHRLREELWMAECKPNGYEVLDVRLSGVEARLKSAQRRILSYLDGRTDALEELAEERLPYYTNEEGKTEPVKCNLWENIVSAANIKGV